MWLTPTSYKVHCILEVFSKSHYSVIIIIRFRFSSVKGLCFLVIPQWYIYAVSVLRRNCFLHMTLRPELTAATIRTPVPGKKSLKSR